MEKIFFQSSLPRSGSTLLQNILAQNPDVYATPTSGLMELIYGARANYSDSPEFLSQDRELMRKAFMAFCDKGIHAFASSCTDRKYFIDKGRSWGFYIDWLEMFMPYRPKVVCVVRDLRDIFASMESLFRKNPDIETKIISWPELRNNTVEKRIDLWANTIPIGIAVERLQSILHNGNAHKILFIKYEDLCLRPEAEIARLYNYLEIPYYNHNFDYIEQVTKEDDSIHRGMTDHNIRHNLQLLPSRAKEVLGPHVCEWIVKRYGWFYDYFKYNK